MVTITLYVRQEKRQMYRTVIWTLWERARAGWFGRMALKHVNYHMWNESPVQVQCMIQGARGWCTGMTQRDGMGREVGWGSGWETHVHPWWNHVNVWQNQYNIVKWKNNFFFKEKTLMLGKIEGRRRGRQSMRCLDSITTSVDMNLSKLWEIVKDRGGFTILLLSMGSQRVRHNLVTEK